MKKQFILTTTNMKNLKGGKGRGNAKNVFPELPAEGEDGLTNVPALPAEQKGKGKRPF